MRFVLRLLAAGLIAVPALSSVCQATLWMPGSHQGWDIGTAPAMVETPPASGIHGLSPSAAASTLYEFKIVDDQGTPPPTWSDPQPGSNGSNIWFMTDAGGSATVTIDTNTYLDGFSPSTNRVTVSTDAALLNFFAVGDWMTAAGGGGNWNPGDPAFQMSNIGGSLWGKDVTIASPGNYQWKATKGDWAGQWGPDSRSVNAGTWNFSTTQANQQVRFLLDLGKGAISLQFVPEPTSLTLLGLGFAAVMGVSRRRK